MVVSPFSTILLETFSSEASKVSLCGKGLKVAKMINSLLEGIKIFWEKEKMLVTSIFSNCFQKLSISGFLYLGLCAL